MFARAADRTLLSRLSSALPAMSLAAPVAALLDRFQASRPVRAWSLIITLYGDAIVPRGGSLWLGSLTEIMALLGIDAGHVRTATSRLVTDGWLERERIGRNSYYRLSRREQASFAAATRRIYFGTHRKFDGRLRLALLGPQLDDPPAARRLLEAEGFAALSPAVYVGLADASPEIAIRSGMFLIATDPGASGPGIAEATFRLAPLAAAYREFLAQFSPLDRRFESEPAPADALVARLLLIHEFRRIVLRDPALPTGLLPPDWPGKDSRALAARIYRRLVPAAELFLDRNARNEHGPLPPPDAGFFRRFADR
jgi:phenylacetic acid degradation operon negative regulatory protein